MKKVVKKCPIIVCILSELSCPQRFGADDELVVMDSYI